jgi:hypothetical protein
MHKSATKCNKTIGKWCKNKHGASKIIDTFETYQDTMLINASRKVLEDFSKLGQQKYAASTRRRHHKV